MRKTILLAVIACILGIVLLAALAFYIPNSLTRSKDEEQSEHFTGFEIQEESSPKAALSHAGSEDTDSSPALPQDTLPKESGKVVSDTEETAAGPEDDGTEDETEAAAERFDRSLNLPGQVKKHQIIWVGDSRTLGLRDALHKTERIDEDLFIGKVGEGVRWFREEAMSELSDVIADYPTLPVVMNFGVNDPQLIDEYVVAYWDVIRAHPDTKFYILSVNPLDEEFLIEDGLVNESVFEDINSLNVARMNVKLKDEFGSRYIDSASYLKSDGYDTVDGLHFSTQTYLKIHDYVVNKLFP